MGMGQMMSGMFGNMGQQQAGAAPPPAGGPPPLPQAAGFFVAMGGQQAGPFDLNALQQHVQSGQLTKETLVWKDGMANWTAAGQVPELSNLFGAAPPPLPPTG
jgi:hypothetical protein